MGLRCEWIFQCDTCGREARVAAEESPYDGYGMKTPDMPQGWQVNEIGAYACLECVTELWIKTFF